MLLYYHTFPPQSHTHTHARICSGILTHFTMATILFHVLCVLLKRSERRAACHQERRSSHLLISLREGSYILLFPLFYFFSGLFFSHCQFFLTWGPKAHTPSLTLVHAPLCHKCRISSFACVCCCRRTELSNTSMLSVYKLIKAGGCFYWFCSEAINMEFIFENNIVQSCVFFQRPPAGQTSTLPCRQMHI